MTVEVHFVYSYGQPGRYHVFTSSPGGTRLVRRSWEPMKKSHAWGWEADRTPMYPGGQVCDAGFATRKDAGVAMVAAVYGIESSEVRFDQT